MRVLGVDLGLRRTGLAVSDEDGEFAFPLKTLHSKVLKEALQGVATVVAEEKVTKVVLGLPLDLSGAEGDGAYRSRRFAEALKNYIEVPIILWDERLSTAQVEKELRRAKVRGRNIREQVDQGAAAILLQSYLDAERFRRSAND